MCLSFDTSPSFSGAGGSLTFNITRCHNIFIYLYNKHFSTNKMR